MTVKLPFAQTPHWLMLSTASVGAKTLYTLLVMHVNRSDPANRTAWPERETLAEMMGFTRPQSVDPYIRELEDIGAITVTRGRHLKQPLRRRNFYHLVMGDDPAPAGLPDLSLTDWYRNRRFEDEEHGGAVERTSVEAEADPWATSEPENGPEVRYSAPSEVRSDAPSEVRQTAQELEEPELDQGEKDQSPAKRAASRADAKSSAPHPYCGLNGCVHGFVWVEPEIDPLGIVRCPNCNSLAA